MNRKSLQFIIIILLTLIVIIGILIFVYYKNQIIILNSTNINIEEPGFSVDIDIENKLSDLINDFEKLSYDEVQEKIEYIISKLPIKYKDKEIEDVDNLKIFIANGLQVRDDYQNKEDFLKIFNNYIFSNLFSEYLEENKKYEQIDNYNYYNRFKEKCPEIIKNDLDAYKINDYKKNISSLTVSDGTISIYKKYYRCQAIFDSSICDNLLGETNSTYYGEVAIRSNKELCLLHKNEDLMNYFLFNSSLKCEEIDFTKIYQKCGAPLNCLIACKVIRKELDVEQINSSNGFQDKDKIQFESFVNNNINLCSEIVNYTNEVDDVSECQYITQLWSAIAGKSIEQLDELGNSDGVITAKYLINNMNEIGTQLDQQIINNTYNFNFIPNPIIDFCKEAYYPDILDGCDISLEDLLNSFNSIKEQRILP